MPLKNNKIVHEFEIKSLETSRKINYSPKWLFFTFCNPKVQTQPRIMLYFIFFKSHILLNIFININFTFTKIKRNQSLSFKKIKENNVKKYSSAV